MNEALILEKLDQLSQEIQTLKSEINQGKQTPLPSTENSNNQIQELTCLVKELHTNVADMHEVQSALKAGLELTNDLQPVAKQLLPKAIGYLDEIDDRFNIEDLTLLVTKALTSLEAMNEALDMLKSGVELRDDLIPIAKLTYPKLQKFLSALHEGEFQAEQLGTLLHTILLNVHTFSDLMNMISPMTELVKEFEVVMRQTDVLSNMNRWLDSLQQGNGAIKLAGTAMIALKQINLSEGQINQMCSAIKSIDFSKVEPVGPMAMVKQLRDPRFQETMGALFMITQAVGSCLQACQNKEETTV